jgi:exopolysaccharide biosynthesis polyprenyl glycosylphosphotransferase
VGTSAEPQPAVRREVLLAALDIAAFFGASMLALHLRFGVVAPHAHALPYLTLWPALVLWRMAVAYGAHLYDFRHRLAEADHIFAAAGASVAGVAGGYLFLALVQLYYMPDWRLSRAVAVLDLLLLFFWLAASRTAMLAWLRRAGFQLRVFLAGPREACGELAEEIDAYAPAFVHVAGSYHLDAAPPQAAPLAAFEEALARREADYVVLAETDLPQDVLSSLLLRCDRSGAEVFLYPALSLSLLASTRVHGIGGLPLVALNPLAHDLVYRLLKRAIDAAAAAAGLLLAAPPALAAALAVKLSSPGPVFFSQERRGRYGQDFRIYKFRTMVADAEAQSGPVLSTLDDPRITAAGRVLRRLRIDEIPQLWNVLKGDMSLVGPRPERPAFADQFTAENPLYARRHLVRPGLTGLAQIHGRYDTDYRHKLRYDVIYINSMSLAADLRILLATIRIVMTGKGAV